MKEIRFYNHKKFFKWLNKLDHKTEAIILKQIEKMGRLGVQESNNLKAISGAINLYELKIYYGAGYRVYFTVQNEEIVIILCAGDKSSQNRDIKNAKIILEKVEEL